MKRPSLLAVRLFSPRSHEPASDYWHKYVLVVSFVLVMLLHRKSAVVKRTRCTRYS